MGGSNLPSTNVPGTPSLTPGQYSGPFTANPIPSVVPGGGMPNFDPETGFPQLDNMFGNWINGIFGHEILNTNPNGVPDGASNSPGGIDLPGMIGRGVGEGVQAAWGTISPGIGEALLKAAFVFLAILLIGAGLFMLARQSGVEIPAVSPV